MYESDRVAKVLANFSRWLDAYGETSWDHQSFFAGLVGRYAKSLYYRNAIIGTAAVSPMIFAEAFLPSARRLFHNRLRFPIADAHYAMGFALLYEVTEDPICLQKAVHFLDALKKSRCSRFKEYCWGYPFNWVWRGGTVEEGTPLITTTPYVYEAFLQTYEIFERASNPALLSSGLSFLDRRAEWRRILESIARHACFDIKDFEVSENSSSCSYSPFGEGGVINAAAYRAFLLTNASQIFHEKEYWVTAERNVNFVLDNQNPDGSWYYAVDEVRDFVDHYHTCFVMKALAKIHALTGHAPTLKALDKGISYYLNNLFDADGLPKPFSRAPRRTVYKRELYDCAECINLCLLLRDRFPALEPSLKKVVGHILEAWVKRDGSFRSRRLHLGWDNVPMHRWGQAQMFRSLAFYLREAREASSGKNRVKSAPLYQLSTLNSQPV